jgi:hypothetical protein
MTFGFQNKIGILVQAVDMHHNIDGDGKWYCSLFHMIAPTVIMQTFLEAKDKLRAILLTGEDGAMYRIDGVSPPYTGFTVGMQDMTVVESMTCRVDDVVLLDKGPSHESAPEKVDET